MRFLFVILAMLTTSAAAQTATDVPAYDGIAVSQVRDVLTDLGYRADAGTISETGMPFVQSGAHGIDFVIYFYQCEEDIGCTSVQFTAVWRSEGNENVDLNRWNNYKRFLVAFRQDDGTIGARMDANVDEGVTVENFEDTFQIWVAFLHLFDQYRRTGRLS